MERPYLLNVGALHAGDWPSMTPGKAELDVRLGLPIRLEPADGQARLAAAVRAASTRRADVEFRGFRARGYAFDERLAARRPPLPTATRRCTGAGPSPSPRGRRPTCASSHRPSGRARRSATGRPGGGLHGVDEWVDLESIADVATVLALLLRRWGESSRSPDAPERL